MQQLLVLVEGQTEERFVKDVLGPEFHPHRVYTVPVLVTTKRTRSGKKYGGGMTSFAKCESDLRKLLSGAAGGSVTTLFDYYGLPEEFPGMSTRPSPSTPQQRVEHVEGELHAHFGNRHDFVPFLALHEFEAWLFCSEVALPGHLGRSGRATDFAKLASGTQSPEEINDHPETAPSKRLLELFPEYDKVLHGPAVTAEIGLELIAERCPHFRGWLSRLEASLDRSPS